MKEPWRNMNNQEDSQEIRDELHEKENLRANGFFPITIYPFLQALHATRKVALTDKDGLKCKGIQR